MNLTPKNWKKSEVEEQQDRVVVGTKLIYSDMCNYRTFTVAAIEDSLMILIDEDGEMDSADIEGLQIGWSFSS